MIIDFANTEIRSQLRAMGLRHASEVEGAQLVTVACDRRIVQVWALPR